MTVGSVTKTAQLAYDAEKVIADDPLSFEGY
jgi:hypothetical protein